MDEDGLIAGTSVSEEEPTKLEEIPLPEQSEGESKEEPVKETSEPAPIREWDLGKPGVGSLLSQAQWVERNRKTRDNDFAPPKAYHRKDSTYGFVRAKDQKPRKKQRTERRSSFELEERDDEQTPNREDSRLREEGRDRDFAPPSTYDYFGPGRSGSARFQNKVQNDSLEEAVSQGLSALRKQSQNT